MPIHSIDYLNARRALQPASGGTNYAKRDRMFNVAARKLADAELDDIALLHEQVRLVFAEFRSWFAASTNDLHAPLDTADDGLTIPF